MKWQVWRLRDITIKRKIIMIVMLTTLAALMLTTAANIGSQIVSARQQWREDMSGTAAMLGNACSASISFDDAASADERLGTLKAKPWISAAHVYKTDGVLFAKYLTPSVTAMFGSEETKALNKTNIEVIKWAGAYAHCWAPIVLDHQKIGVVHLAADTSPLATLVRQQIMISMGALLFAAMGALIFATRLQRFVSVPVLHMLETMQAVSKDGNYAARAKEWGHDELGRLVNGLNGMLAQIETHVSERARYSQTLEQEVAERTADLTAAKDRAEKASAINEARDIRLHAQNDALAKLVANPILHAGDLPASARLVSETASYTLGVDRVGVWFFTADRKALECTELYEVSSGRHLSERRIVAEDYPEYFEALKSSRSIVADDTYNDPRTKSMARQYLAPIGITSMLDCGIRRAGEVVGVVCHEHVGPARTWAIDEQNFAASLADLMGVALEASERTQAQAELVAARDAAEAANKAKTQFLANMSHEIRTPINGVTGMLQVLRKDDLTDKQRRFMDMALSSANSLLAVIGDVLDFSKVEAGYMELDLAEFSIRQAVDGAVRMFAEGAESKNIELSYSVAPDLPDRLIGDSARLCQIIINLVGNALKFTDSGEIHIGVNLVSNAPSAVGLGFFVKDTGPGIPEGQRDMIFQSFAQGDASMRRRHGGTGLGLAISRHLVALMGGRIWAESEVGRGSSFHFTARFGLPQSAVTSELRGLEGPAEAKVLVVDDMATARSVTCDYLRSWGCIVFEASDAAEALDELRRAATSDRPYNMAVLDATLKGVDGYELARMVRNAPQHETIGVVILSGFDVPSEEKLSECGIRVALPKPLRASQLYDAVITIANGTWTRKVVETSAPTPDLISIAGASILLVEDNEINQEVAREMINQLGHSCVCAASGQQAMEAIVRSNFDLILMDCQMPVMDGYETTAAIRKWERQASRDQPTPIIALTAHAMQGDRERCLNAGMDEYLTKPLQADKLASALAKWLKARKVVAAEDTEWNERELEVAVISRCSGVRSLAGRLLRSFTAQSQEDIDTITASVAEGDHERMHHAAHRLKGAAGNLGLDKCHQAASELVKLARSGLLNGFEPHLAALRTEAARITRMKILNEGL